MNNKECGYCGKTYTPKSNNSKFCSKSCNNKASNKRRTEKYRTDKNFHDKINESKKKRFFDRYHNELGFKEKHIQSCLKWRSKNKDQFNEYMRKSFKERYRTDLEFREKWKQRTQDIYKKNKEMILKRNSNWRKSDPGKIAGKRHKAKRRRLGDICLSGNALIFPPETKPEFAHINELMGFMLPKITHNYVNGRKKQEHTENTKKWIRKLYCIYVP